MHIEYKFDFIPATEEIINLYRSAGLNRPVDDEQRIRTMYKNSNLVITAWHGNQLIGIARNVTDFCYCCYLSDLAVCLPWQKQGIGKKLIELTKERIGDCTMLLLLSAPAAMEYYPKIGMNKVENGYIIPRTR